MNFLVLVARRFFLVKVKNPPMHQRPNCKENSSLQCTFCRSSLVRFMLSLCPWSDCWDWRKYMIQLCSNGNWFFSLHLSMKVKLLPLVKENVKIIHLSMLRNLFLFHYLRKCGFVIILWTKENVVTFFSWNFAPCSEICNCRAPASCFCCPEFPKSDINNINMKKQICRNGFTENFYDTNLSYPIL